MLRKDKHPYHVFPLQRGGREGRCIHFLLLGNKSPHLVLTTFSVNQEFRYEFAVFSAGIEVLAGAVVSSKSIHFICRILFFFFAAVGLRVHISAGNWPRGHPQLLQAVLKP